MLHVDLGQVMSVGGGWYEAFPRGGREAVGSGRDRYAAAVGSSNNHVLKRGRICARRVNGFPSCRSPEHTFRPPRDE